MKSAKILTALFLLVTITAILVDVFTNGSNLN